MPSPFPLDFISIHYVSFAILCLLFLYPRSIVDHKDKRLCSVPNFLFAIHSIYVIIMRNYGFNIDHPYHINNPLPDLLHLSSNCQYESTNNMQNFKDPNEHALNHYQHSTTRKHRLLLQLLLPLAIGASLSPLPL